MLAILKSVELMVFMVNTGCVGYDEDMNTELFDVGLPYGVDVGDVAAALAEMQSSMVSPALQALFAFRREFLLLLASVKDECRLKGDALTDLQSMLKHVSDLKLAYQATNTDEKAVFGFDVSIPRQLVSASPPRSIILPSFADATDMFTHMIQHLIKIKHASQKVRSVRLLTEFLYSMATQRPEPNSLTRSILHVGPTHQ
jgi:hypothetical protein